MVSGKCWKKNICKEKVEKRRKNGKWIDMYVKWLKKRKKGEWKQKWYIFENWIPDNLKLKKKETSYWNLKNEIASNWYCEIEKC